MSLKDITFDAIDGEGFTDEKGEHYYNILVARCHDTDWQLAWGARQKKYLSSSEIFAALTLLGGGKNRIHVAYYFNYDVTKWMQDWSPTDRITLWKNGEITWSDASGNEYYVFYIPNKLFRLGWYNEELQRNISLIIYDVFGFFQCSFVKALQNWGFEKEIDYISKMKEARGKFREQDRKEIIKYSLMECDLLCQMMNKVRDALDAENIPMTKWFGAGAIGEALLRRERMEPFIQIPEMTDLLNLDMELEDAVMGAYFGGRFEIFKQGIVNETYQYDINSAYPYAMSTLPDFSNTNIIYVEKYDYAAKFSIWYVTYDIRKNGKAPLFGPFPYRDKTGSISYPYYNPYGVWIHQCELQAALELYGADCFTIHKGYIFFADTTIHPFKFIPKVAEHRLALKKKGDMRNVVLKLGLNSLYGKTAQGTARDGRIPRFQNYFIAGYVTAYCRSQLLYVGFSCGEKGSGVIQFATDGVFASEPSTILGIQSSEKLGDWEFTFINKPVIYLQPGVYFTKRTEESDGYVTKRRTRGFRANRLTADEVFDEWDKNGVYGKLSADSQTFIGTGACIISRKWDKYGRFEQRPHQILFIPPYGKEYLSGHEYIGGNTWNGREITIYGIGRKEANYSNYVILVPCHHYQKGPSLPYKKRYAQTVVEYAVADINRKEYLRADIETAEQPDYERLEFFGDLHRNNGFG